MINLKSLGLAAIIGFITIGVFALQPAQHPDCGFTSKCPQSGWPIVFLRVDTECSGSDGNLGCSPLPAHRYNFRALIFDFFVFSGGAYLISTLLKLKKTQGVKP